MKTGASIGWHASVAAASAGIYMLVTKKGYEGGLKGRETWTNLLVPAAVGGIVGYARTKSDA